MSAVRAILKVIIGLIYVILVAVVLYFPFAQVVTNIATESRLFHLPEPLNIEDSLLPCLGLAVIYAVACALLRRLEPSADMSEQKAPSQALDSK